jgi:hypothetical protein
VAAVLGGASVALGGEDAAEPLHAPTMNVIPSRAAQTVRLVRR